MADIITYADNTFGTLASGITAAATSIALTAGHGVRFPAIAAGHVLYATLLNSSNVVEQIHISAHTASSDTLTVVRGANGTTAKVWSAGDRIECRLTSEHMTNMLGIIAANIAMGGFKLTGLGTGSASGDSVAFGQRTGVKLGTFTRDASLTSALAITGVGFAPKMVVFLTILSSTGISVGIDDGTNHYDMYWTSVPSLLSRANYSISMGSSGGTVMDAFCASLDSDGFTLNFSQTGSPSGTATIYYAAIG